MSQSHSHTGSDMIKKDLEEFLPGFSILHIKDKQGLNNYIVQHENKAVIEALSTQLAKETKLTGSTGNPKYVADHLNNGNYGIVLTDKDHFHLCGYQALGKRMSGDDDYAFKISADSIKDVLPKSPKP